MHISRPVCLFTQVQTACFACKGPNTHTYPHPIDRHHTFVGLSIPSDHPRDHLAQQIETFSALSSHQHCVYLEASQPHFQFSVVALCLTTTLNNYDTTVRGSLVFLRIGYQLCSRTVARRPRVFLGLLPPNHSNKVSDPSQTTKGVSALACFDRPAWGDKLTVDRGLRISAVSGRITQATQRSHCSSSLVLKVVHLPAPSVLGRRSEQHE